MTEKDYKFYLPVPDGHMSQSECIQVLNEQAKKYSSTWDPFVKKVDGNMAFYADKGTVMSIIQFGGKENKIIVSLKEEDK
jgi:hypothetical protein